MRNIKLIIAYDGKNYLGWQKTKEGTSIEQSLQSVIEQILQEKIILQAASRTDAGVHARGQVVNFLIQNPLKIERMLASINSLLPNDIAVISAEEAETHFHATLDCKGKEYDYWICFGKTQFPQNRFYSWHYPYPLNIENMRHASDFFIGSMDFGAFCNKKKNEKYEHHIREIFAIGIESHPEQRLKIRITGKNFLYKMVRNIVGTLAYVGSGKIPIPEIPSLMQAGDRTKAGMTAPAHGLTLHSVIY